MKTLTSILAAGAILAFAAQAGTAANAKHTKQSIIARIGWGYRGDTADAKHSTTRVGSSPYALIGGGARW